MNLVFGRSMQRGCAVLAAGSLLSSCGAARHVIVTKTVPPVHFAVLGSPPAEGDRVSPEVATSLSHSERPTFTSADIRAARRVLANDPGWLVPATNGEICFVRLVYPLLPIEKDQTLNPIPSHICLPERRAQAGQLVETQSLATSGIKPRNYRVLGIVPTGVESVKILSGHGAIITIPVTRNAYEVVVVDPVAVTFRTIRNHRIVTHRVPLGVFAARSALPGPYSRRENFG